MPIGKLKILGGDDVAVSVILDNLESVANFPPIEIINSDGMFYKNKLFSITERDAMTVFPSDDFVFIIAERNPEKKNLHYETFRDSVSLEQYCSIIHKSAQISSTASINKGCLINSLASISAHAIICNFVSIDRNASIGSRTTIGEFVSIGQNSAIGNRVTICRNTTIGAGVIVQDGVKIGSDCNIKSGSIVLSDVPSGTCGFWHEVKK